MSKNGLLIDPVKKETEKMDILVDGDRISKIGGKLAVKGAEILDVKNCYVTEIR